MAFYRLLRRCHTKRTGREQESSDIFTNCVKPREIMEITAIVDGLTTQGAMYIAEWRALCEAILNG